MELDLTKEAIALIHLMTSNPGQAWEKEVWHPASRENADRVACVEMTALARWCDEIGMEKTIPLPEAKEQLLELSERLKGIYAAPEGGDVDFRGAKIPRAQALQMAWSSIDRCFYRPQKPGKYKFKLKYIERLQDLIKHYRGKPVKKDRDICLTMHFADLEAALDGKPSVKADDVMEVEESK